MLQKCWKYFTIGRYSSFYIFEKCHRRQLAWFEHLRHLINFGVWISYFFILNSRIISWTYFVMSRKPLKMLQIIWMQKFEWMLGCSFLNHTGRIWVKLAQRKVVVCKHTFTFYLGIQGTNVPGNTYCNYLYYPPSFSVS